MRPPTTGRWIRRSLGGRAAAPPDTVLARAVSLLAVLAVAAALLAGCTSDGPTTTEISPGLAPDFATFTERFETLLERSDIVGVMPYSVMPSGELAWVAEAAGPLEVTDVKGYRLAGGDTVILFFTTPDFYSSPPEVQRDVFPAADRSLMDALHDRHSGAPIMGTDVMLGHLIVSEQWDTDRFDDLRRVAGAARNYSRPFDATAP